MTVKQKKYYLALGDSYTIGEAVSFEQNFPNQVAARLKDRIDIETRIIAKTGWTTDELEAGIVKANSEQPLRDNYDFVSLLIGVNNQYRGRPVENYAREFQELLRKAGRLAGNEKSRVIVLSIPDWGVTPYAEGRDRVRIAGEIDAYNRVAEDITTTNGIRFLEITNWTREASNDASLLARDGLHPSAKEYSRWADLVCRYFPCKST